MVSLEQVRALEDRVEKAVAYIAALRSENSDLERRLSEGKTLADKAEAKLAAMEAKAGEAAAARDAALARVREFEARVTDMAERVAAAETRAAEINARADEYRKDQARIEEGIIHALEKLDSFEDLVLARPSEPEPTAIPDAEPGRAEGASGIAVKTPPWAGVSGPAAAAAPEDAAADRGIGELDIF